MVSILMRAYGKVNLTLDVLKRRDDGYHDVKMIMQQIDLYDEVRLNPLSQEIHVHTGHSYVPDDDTNIAVKAAKLFFKQTGKMGGVEIIIKKNIPVAAGLAGGSADAAAVLVGLNVLYQGGLSETELMRMGEILGADVPFCIKGGTCLSEGTGVLLTPITANARYWLLLVKPPVGVSTKEVYEGLSISKIKRHPDTVAAIQALELGNVYDLKEAMYNVLEEVTACKLKAIEEIEAKLMSSGAKKAMMSGSGPTVMGLFTKSESAQKAFKSIKKHYQEVILTQPIFGGIKYARE